MRPTRPVLALVWLACACASSTDDRARWLTDALVADAWPQLMREPIEVAGKWAKMADSPYAWLRGTAQVYERDEARLAPGHVPTHRANPNLPVVWLTGDPHLENIAAELGPQGQWTLEFDDMDAATWGPYTFDLRRLALGAWLVAESAPVSDSVRDDWARAAAQGYVDEIVRLSQGVPPTRLDEAGDLGVIFADLMARAHQASEEGNNWASWAHAGAGGHALLRGEIDPPGNGFVTTRLDEPTPSERVLVAASVHDTLGVRVLDVARRRGQGVSSYAHWRFYAVIDGGSDGPEDDFILEWKECSDPLRFDGLPSWIVPPASINGERVVVSARNLQSRPDIDRWLAWTGDQALSAKIRSRADPVGDTERGLDAQRVADKLTKNKWTSEDVRTMADRSGRLLAQAHARAPTPDGKRGLAILAPEVSAIGGDLVAETAASAHAGGVQLRQDREMAKELLLARGPLLGWTPPPPAPGETIR